MDYTDLANKMAHLKQVNDILIAKDLSLNQKETQLKIMEIQLIQRENDLKMKEKILNEELEKKYSELFYIKQIEFKEKIDHDIENLKNYYEFSLKTIIETKIKNLEELNININQENDILQQKNKDLILKDSEYKTEIDELKKKCIELEENNKQLKTLNTKLETDLAEINKQNKILEYNLYKSQENLYLYSSNYTNISNYYINENKIDYPEYGLQIYFKDRLFKTDLESFNKLLSIHHFHSNKLFCKFCFINKFFKNNWTTCSNSETYVHNYLLAPCLKCAINWKLCDKPLISYVHLLNDV